jgi:hypothetical protein
MAVLKGSKKRGGGAEGSPAGTGRGSSGSTRTVSKGFTPAERAALAAYTGGDYDRINSALRGQSKASPETKKLIGDLTKALNRPLGKEMLLKRGLSSESLWNLASSGKLKKGAVIVEKGFMSTTKDRKRGREFATGTHTPVLMRIRTSRNTKGADTSKISKEKVESEVTLQRGTRLKVRSARFTNMTVGFGKNRRKQRILVISANA